MVPPYGLNAAQRELVRGLAEQGKGDQYISNEIYNMSQSRRYDQFKNEKFVRELARRDLIASAKRLEGLLR